MSRLSIQQQRTVALLLRTAGSAALVDAVHRADAARYQEVICRSALNRVEGMPFTWTLNPYRGCTHGCHYCFARRYQSHLELDPGDEFSSVILVKINFPEILWRELARLHGKRCSSPLARQPIPINRSKDSTSLRGARSKP